MKKLLILKEYAWIISSIIGILTISVYVFGFLKSYIFNEKISVAVKYPDYTDIRYNNPNNTNEVANKVIRALNSKDFTSRQDSLALEIANEINIYTSDTFLQKHLEFFHTPTYITFRNNSSRAFKNLKLNCPINEGSYYECPLNIEDDIEHHSTTYIVSNYKHFTTGSIAIREFRPGESIKYALCYSHTRESIEPNQYYIEASHQQYSLTYENGETQEIFPTIDIAAEGKLDYFISHLIIECKFLQFAVYIFTFLGILYLASLIKKVFKKAKVKTTEIEDTPTPR